MEHLVEYANRPEEREDSHLVLMLHGYGSNERDLLGLVPYLPTKGFTYAAMRAPQPVGATLPATASSAVIPGAAFGYQWYPLDRSLNTEFHAIRLATDYLEEFLSSVADTYRSITLLGFSQGMAMATSLARRNPSLPSALVGLSGYAVPDDSDYFRDDELAQAQLPVFYGRGYADPIITESLVDFTERWLPAHAQAETKVYPGLQHSINAEEIEDAAGFLTRVHQQ